MISNTHTITTTASKVLNKSDSNRTVYLHVTGNGIVYIGGSDVTSINGLPTEKHTIPFTVDLPADEELWAVVASATENLRVMYAPTKSGDA